MARPIDPRRIEVVDEAVAAILRTKLPHERIAMASRARRTAWCLIEGGVRYSHPDWTPDQVRAEVLRRLTGGTN